MLPGATHTRSTLPSSEVRSQRPTSSRRLRQRGLRQPDHPVAASSATSGAAAQ